MCRIRCGRRRRSSARIATSLPNGDNNAWMAQLLVQGTNFLNFMGKYIYVAAGKHGFEAVPVAESTEPPAIIGQRPAADGISGGL